MVSTPKSAAFGTSRSLLASGTSRSLMVRNGLPSCVHRLGLDPLPPQLAACLSIMFVGRAACRHSSPSGSSAPQGPIFLHFNGESLLVFIHSGRCKGRCGRPALSRIAFNGLETAEGIKGTNFKHVNTPVAPASRRRGTR